MAEKLRQRKLDFEMLLNKAAFELVVQAKLIFRPQMARPPTPEGHCQIVTIPQARQETGARSAGGHGHLWHRSSTTGYPGRSLGFGRIQAPLLFPGYPCYCCASAFSGFYKTTIDVSAVFSHFLSS